MALHYLEFFMGILGFGFSILFCLTFCKLCSRFTREHMQANAEPDGRPSPIYVIPFPRSLSQDSEENFRVPRYSEALQAPLPPQCGPAVFCEPPPAYNELEFKPVDVPPAYTEYAVPVYPITPLPEADAAQPQTQPRPASQDRPQEGGAEGDA